MSLWHKKAFEQLPELHSALQESDNMYSFFSDLSDALDKATTNKEDDLINRIYHYALWCLKEAPRGKTAENDVINTLAAGETVKDSPFPIYGIFIINQCYCR